MIIRHYQESDFEHVKQLFHDTVHAIMSQDYNPLQIAAMAPVDHSHENKRQAFKDNIVYVALDNNHIIGFVHGTSGGHLEHIYTHKDHQGKGVATLLLNTLEDEMRTRNIKEITTQASITAKSFFEKRGYSIIKENVKEYRGMIFRNYSMIKKL
jgi:putative acetyltransferase